MLKDCKSQQEVLLLLERNGENIQAVAEKCLEREESGYEARVLVDTWQFPAKSYGKYCFPGGEYRALRVEIGEAVGKNWWCVLFPPLCYVSENAISVNESAESAMYESLSDEAFETVKGEIDDTAASDNVISEESGICSNVKVSCKFKIVEFFRRITKRFG